MHKIQPLPITDSVMLRYLAYLDLLGINVRTMRVYLAGIRALQIENGMSEPLIYTPLVQLMVKSFEKSNDAPLRVLPMTYDIMLQVASKLKNGWDDTMVWACMTIAFYGCLRAGEVCPVMGVADSAPLLRNQVVLYDQASPPYCVLHITHTKTQPKGVRIIVGCSGTSVCGYCAMRNWLSILSNCVTPYLFCLFQSGHNV